MLGEDVPSPFPGDHILLLLPTLLHPQFCFAVVFCPQGTTVSAAADFYDSNAFLNPKPGYRSTDEATTASVLASSVGICYEEGQVYPFSTRAEM